MTPLLLEALSLGFFGGLVPGPVLTAVFMETLRGGAVRARRIILLAALGELLLASICVFAASFIAQINYVFTALSLFGALLLFSIAWDLWKTSEIREMDPLFLKRRIFFVAILNGMAWIFWITVCTPRAIALGKIHAFGAAMYIFLFELGWLIATTGISELTELFRHYFQENKKLNLLYRAVAIFFLLFGFKLAYGSIQSLLR